MAQRPAEPSPTTRRPTRVVVLVLVIVVVIAAVLGMRWWRDAQMHGAVRASGMIEMDETDVASLVGGRIMRLNVIEGDTVHVGDTLVVLSRGEISADLLAQRAQLGRATAQSQQVVTGPRAQEVAVAKADLDGARAQREMADRDLDRMKKLLESHVVAQADYDRAVTNHDDAVAREVAAREKLRLLQAGSRSEEITAARANTEAMRAAVAGAESRIAELVLVAPMSGVVLLKNFEIGELVQPNQPVVTLGDPERLWLRVYVAAPRITDVRIGAPVEVRLGKDSKAIYHGRVTEVATQAEFTPRAALTEEERADLVFAVRIRLDPTHGALKAGLPADAYIGALTPAP
ncbi:MAG: HlyD family secretion protein [Candidatus Eisenbacteria bacterium]